MHIGAKVSHAQQSTHGKRHLQQDIVEISTEPKLRAYVLHLAQTCGCNRGT
jgi:hypothetical protein